jgi:hypothetical protein
MMKNLESKSEERKKQNSTKPSDLANLFRVLNKKFFFFQCNLDCIVFHVQKFMYKNRLDFKHSSSILDKNFIFLFLSNGKYSPEKSQSVQKRVYTKTTIL